MSEWLAAGQRNTQAIGGQSSLNLQAGGMDLQLQMGSLRANAPLLLTSRGQFPNVAALFHVSSAFGLQCLGYFCVSLASLPELLPKNSVSAPAGAAGAARPPDPRRPRGGGSCCPASPPATARRSDPKASSQELGSLCKKPQMATSGLKFQRKPPDLVGCTCQNRT